MPPDSTVPPRIEDDEAERLALEAAVAVAREDIRAGRVVPHEEVRAWLLRLANGEFGARAPKSRAN